VADKEGVGNKDDLGTWVLQDGQDSLEFQAHLVTRDHNPTSSHFWNKSSSLKVAKKDLHRIHFHTCRPKLDQLDLEADLVCKALQAHRVSKDPWVKGVIQVHQDHQDLLVQEVFQVLLEKMVKVEGMENKDPRDHPDLQAKEDCLACLVYLDQRDTGDFLVLMVPKVALEDLGIKEKKGHLDPQAPQDPWELLGQEEKEVERDLLDLLVSGELME